MDCQCFCSRWFCWSVHDVVQKLKYSTVSCFKNFRGKNKEVVACHFFCKTVSWSSKKNKSIISHNQKASNPFFSVQSLTCFPFPPTAQLHFYFADKPKLFICCVCFFLPYLNFNFFVPNIKIVIHVLKVSNIYYYVVTVTKRCILCYCTLVSNVLEVSQRCILNKVLKGKRM